MTLNRFTLLFCALVLILTACSGGGGGSSPEKSVEEYLRTRTTGDENKIVALACKARESDARNEAASFGAMSPVIENISCTAGEKEGEFTIVSCVGKMVTTYAGESRNWDLGARQYKSLQEDGAWKYCGVK